jgi:putative membrane protein insertion efficiency factor
MSVRRALLGAVRFYQRAISPARPPSCRFVPTCSEYAVEALETHGALRGSRLALVRLLKCAPWHPGGIDLVPEPRSGRRTGTAQAARSSNTAAPTSPDSGHGAGPAVPAGDRLPGSRHPAGLRPGSPAGDLPC